MVRLASVLAALLLPALGLAAEGLKPFTLAQKAPGEPAAVVAEVTRKLEAAGFQVVGSYSPYRGATVVAVTSPELKAAAARSRLGGYGAVQRVTVTKLGDEVQVAFTNPAYMQHAYRMKGELGKVGEQLSTALGRLEDFGTAEGKSPKDLTGYHYMFGMPYFDEPWELGKRASQAEALKAVEEGLAAGRGRTKKVYRVDVSPEESVFGVALHEGCGADYFVMKEVDAKALRSTGHLPYELLVSGGEILALHAKFRIAMNFPDLSMMGANSFMGIRCAPDSIEAALQAVAGK